MNILSFVIIIYEHIFRHLSLQSVRLCCYTIVETQTSVAAVGTAKIADCIDVLQMGHLGGPLVFCRLGFKQRPWNMWPQGRSWVSTLTDMQRVHFVEDGTSTEVFATFGSGMVPPLTTVEGYGSSGEQLLRLRLGAYAELLIEKKSPMG